MNDNKNVDVFYNHVDNACMIIHEALKVDYLTCLIRVGNDILNETDETGLSDEVISNLNTIYQAIMNQGFINEEVRQAMELLIVKGFKHSEKYGLDLMTPDAIGYLFAYIINKLLTREAVIMDVALGTSNLLNVISNFREHLSHLIGIEKEEELVKLAKVNCDLQNNDITIYYNDCLKPIYELCDLVVGDLDTYEVDGQYFPYLVVNKFLDNLNDDGYFIYLIPNDFFNQKGNMEFKQNLDGTILGLIVLPESMFNNKYVGKSIIIGTKKSLEAVDMMVVRFPSLSEQTIVKTTIEKIDKWIENLKGMMI
jgi:site-specific DNA-methyltransferase (adenine-specific)